MKVPTVPTLLLALHLPLCTIAHAQDLSLKKRSALELSIGLWSGRASSVVTVSGVQAEVGTNGFVGGLQFTHWMQEYLAVTLSAGVLSGKVSTTVQPLNVTQHVSSVVPILLGLRYYALGAEADGDVRPYVSGAAGAYIGSEVGNSILSQGSRTEAAFGGRFGAGVDFILSDHFKLGAHSGYNVMSDFTVPVGGRRNYNGGDFSVGLGYIF